MIQTSHWTPVRRDRVGEDISIVTLMGIQFAKTATRHLRVSELPEVGIRGPEFSV